MYIVGVMKFDSEGNYIETFFFEGEYTTYGEALQAAQQMGLTEENADIRHFPA